MTLQQLLYQISTLPIALVYVTFFLLALLPVPFPNELLTSIVLAYDKASQFGILINLVIIMTVGEIVWASVLFYLVKHHIHRIHLPKARTTLPMKHWLNRFGMMTFIASHGVIGFLITPTISFIVPYINDFLIILVAHRGGHYPSFLLYYLVGSTIRAVIGVMTVKTVLGI